MILFTTVINQKKAGVRFELSDTQDLYGQESRAWSLFINYNTKTTVNKQI